MVVHRNLNVSTPLSFLSVDVVLLLLMMVLGKEPRTIKGGSKQSKGKYSLFLHHLLALGIYICMYKHSNLTSPVLITLSGTKKRTTKGGSKKSKSKCSLSLFHLLALVCFSSSVVLRSMTQLQGVFHNLYNSLLGFGHATKHNGRVEATRHVVSLPGWRALRCLILPAQRVSYLKNGGLIF